MPRRPLKKDKFFIVDPKKNKGNTEIITQLKHLNAQKLNHTAYCEQIKKLFNIPDIEADPKRISILFMAGFIEGEGSISISVGRSNAARTGILLDAHFNVTQHIDGIIHLYRCLLVFETGRIRFKVSSNATFVFVVEARSSIYEKVCPFFENYILPYSCSSKIDRYRDFKHLLELMYIHRAHLDKNRMIEELLPVWSRLRKQKGNKNETFPSLEAAKNYVVMFGGPLRPLV